MPAPIPAFRTASGDGVGQGLDDVGRRGARRRDSRMIASAASTGIAARYGRSAVSASKTSATATIRAPSRELGSGHARGSSPSRRAARGGTRRARRRSANVGIGVEDPERQLGMAADDLHLGGVEPARLVEDGVRDAELAQVVEQARATDVDDVGCGQPDARGQALGEVRDARRVRAGERALRVDDVGEGGRRSGRRRRRPTSGSGRPARAPSSDRRDRGPRGPRAGRGRRRRAARRRCRGRTRRRVARRSP